MRFACRVSDEGLLVPVEPERTRRYRGKEIFVSIHAQPFARSSQSNRYLWAAVYGAIAAETGNDPETIHYALKREAVRVGVLDPQYVLMGDKLFEDEPTTKVDQDAFNKYVSWVVEGCLTGTLVGMRIHIEG